MSSVESFDESEFTQSILVYATSGGRWVCYRNVRSRLVDAHSKCAKNTFTGVLVRVIETICSKRNADYDHTTLNHLVVAITMCIIGSPCMFAPVAEYKIEWTHDQIKMIVGQIQRKHRSYFLLRSQRMC